MTEFKNRYIKEDLIYNKDTATRDTDILILFSLDFKSASESSNM